MVVMCTHDLRLSGYDADYPWVELQRVFGRLYIRVVKTPCVATLRESSHLLEYRNCHYFPCYPIFRPNLTGLHRSILHAFRSVEDGLSVSRIFYTDTATVIMPVAWSFADDIWSNVVTYANDYPYAEPQTDVDETVPTRWPMSRYEVRTRQRGYSVPEGALVR